jgi:hypothetical protein
VYKQFKDFLLPVLVRVFCVIGSTGRVPTNFLDGAIVAILKPGGDPIVSVTGDSGVQADGVTGVTGDSGVQADHSVEH